MPPAYSRTVLTEKILMLFKDWGIDRKMMCLTLDNATLNDTSVDMLKSQLQLLCDGSYFHVHCCAHILNLIVKKG